MRNTLEVQLEPCAKNGRSVQPPPTAESNPSPVMFRATCDDSVPESMVEHGTQAAFLRALIADEDDEASRQLRDGLAKADRESKRIRHALFLMLTLFFLSLAGLSYCFVWLPQIFSNPAHWATKSLTVLGLASLIAQLEFFGFLLWHRLTVNRLHKECRRRVLVVVRSLLGNRQKPASTFLDASAQQAEGPSPQRHS